MTKEQQRIAIAEACGWKPFIFPKQTPSGNDICSWKHPTKDIIVFYDDLPNYPECLNAMHEAEKTLQHYGTFVDVLAKVMKQPRQGIMLPLATSAQRSEAFLRTIGKWIETPTPDADD